MKEYFEYQTTGSFKFWEIQRKDNKITTRWGKIGSDGSSKTKDYGNKAKDKYEKLIKSKQNKGYILVTNSDLRRSSKKMKTKKVTMKGKKYFTHDNGGRPFLVVINKKNVKIFKVPKDVNDENIKNDAFIDFSKDIKYYSELIKEYKSVKDIFIGKSSEKSKMAKWSGGYGKKFDGNSILLEIKDKQYCYIGNFIFEFTTKDKINKFESPVGGNDVPYPIAYGEDNIYFFDFDCVKRLQKELFSGMDVDNLWDEFYGNSDKKGLDNLSKKLKTIIIHKRLW